jgi:hypothetical protein
MPPYEIALSFAGEDRTYVEMVARFLQSHHVSLFFDDYNDVDLWGQGPVCSPDQGVLRSGAIRGDVHFPELRGKATTLHTMGDLISGTEIWHLSRGGLVPAR